jgi:hypothetical protein
LSMRRRGPVFPAPESGKESFSIQRPALLV